jgi:hypothetical protein
MSIRPSRLVLAVLVLAAGCFGDDPHAGGNENELITTVTLVFTPEGGGDATIAVFDDPDGDGGEPPTVDPIALAAGTAYGLSIGFENGLEAPPEDITEEVADEAEEHQVFLTGTAVDGPASDRPDAPLAHAYADEDGTGLPLGLVNEIAASSGEGELTVTLRHLPPIDGAPGKVAELAATVAADGFAAIGGATDAQVTFDVVVP